MTAIVGLLTSLAAIGITPRGRDRRPTSTTRSAALAIHGGKRHCVHISTADGLHHNWRDGTSWSPTHQVRHRFPSPSSR
ncbi:hypothetical protein [Streptomyces sp. NPDC059918]|uniref:hypothetical protein n=1 Tax=unclassified Streptomyces TaxID=2593676 RepID=UPI00365D4D6E